MWVLRAVLRFQDSPIHLDRTWSCWSCPEALQIWPPSEQTFLERDFGTAIHCNFDSEFLSFTSRGLQSRGNTQNYIQLLLITSSCIVDYVNQSIGSMKLFLGHLTSPALRCPTVEERLVLNQASRSWPENPFLSINHHMTVSTLQELS